jgi:hypothetical protein
MSDTPAITGAELRFLAVGIDPKIILPGRAQPGVSMQSQCRCLPDHAVL